MKTKPKICFKCKLKIFDKENYFSFVEYNDGRKIRTDYAHKKCWDEIKGTLKVTNKAMGMITGLKKSLVKQGILNEEDQEWQVA